MTEPLVIEGKLALLAASAHFPTEILMDGSTLNALLAAQLLAASYTSGRVRLTVEFLEEPAS